MARVVVSLEEESERAPEKEVPAKEVQSLLRDPEGGLDKTLRTLTEKRDEYQSRVKGLDDHLEMLRERPTQAATQREN